MKTVNDILKDKRIADRIWDYLQSKGDDLTVIETIKDCMHTYAAQFQQKWVLPDSTEKHQTDNLENCVCLFTDGTKDFYYDYFTNPHDRRVLSMVFLLPSPPKEK